jgi:aminoacrylate hydrolase
MPSLSIGDADIHYQITGDGPPLMLAPGLAGFGSFWSHQVPALADEFRVITFDHRGCGASTKSAITYSIDQMAADTLRLMDGLGIERTHFIGHSTGGAIGQTIAQDAPDRLISLVLSATWAGPDAYFRRCFESRLEILNRLGLVSYLRASLLLLWPDYWISSHDRELAEQEPATLAVQSPPEIIASRIAAVMAFDRRHRLGEIATPTLVICAGDDITTPAYMSQELAAAIDGARLVLLDRGGHFVTITEPASYNQAVLEFLRARAAG